MIKEDPKEMDGSSESDGNASFLRAARDGNLPDVLEYLKGSTDINTSNANGLNALHLASKEGHITIVTELLKRGANVEAATKKGNTALHIASLAGHLDIVKLLLNTGAKVNVQSQTGFTPLYMGAQEGHAEVVKHLLATGASQSLATGDGFTPLAVALQQERHKVVSVLLEHDTKGKVRLPALHIAAKKDDVKSAALLLQNEQNSVDSETKNAGLVNDTTKSGFTPLHIASHYGNVNVATLLIQRGADVNFKAKNNITPLHVASRWGKANMITLLLDSNSHIDDRTRDGLTPLHCAARSGHENVVDILLERGAPYSAKTKNGLTPIHMAAQGDHVDCARLLLYHKAPVDDVTVDYLTPLHVAAHCGNVKTAKLLLDRKCDPNSRALNGFTPLHIACKKNRIKVVELLLKYGASIEATTESGLTPLHVASFMGHMNIVYHLIRNNANPDYPTVRGETALHLAARANQTDIIRILLRNGASVDAKAREQQTPLHIAARLGNVDNVVLFLQHGADANAVTKDLYTPLHIAAKEGHEEVAAVLLEHMASHSLTTKKGFTPLHIAAKYGNIKVARLLLQKEANPDVQGKNGLTPLHVATHYNHVNVALLLLDHKASPHSAAKNGYTPLHIAAKKNQMDIATTLLEYSADPNAESKNGFTPLHLAAQEGHTDMVSLLLEHKGNVTARANNGLCPLHLAAQEDRVSVAEVLVKSEVVIDPQTKAGYTPLHTACHFGQINMVRFLLDREASVSSTTKLGYTPLHQASQQGHVMVVNLLLKNKASPNAVTNQGQTALSIAQRLGYISVVEALKGVTEVTETVPSTEDKYKVVSPEVMQETMLSDSEDEGGDDFMPQSPLFGKPLSEQHVYLPYVEGKQLREDSISLERTSILSPLDNSYDKEGKSRMDSVFEDTGPSANSSMEVDPNKSLEAPRSLEESINELEYDDEFKYLVDDSAIKKDFMEAQIVGTTYAAAPTSHPDNRYNATLPTGDNTRFSSYSGSSFNTSFDPDNVSVDKSPVYTGKLKWKSFLISFMVDARGGAMRGCRHSGVRIIIPPRKACMPTRVTCRLIKKEKLLHPPPMNEGEALATRILEMGPVATKFLGPVIIEVPHFASLRGKEREITILRSDDGEHWYDHTMVATDDAVSEALGGSIDELDNDDDLANKRIARIITTDFPQYFAIVTRIRQENCNIGDEGGVISSTVVPQVQAVFPEGALTKKIKVGLQAQPIQPEVIAKLLGNRVAVSPIVTVEPRRRKFHKPITLTIPVPRAAQKGMINQYGSSSDAPTLRLLCSISGGTSPAVWEDITANKHMSFVNDCVSFTTTVSARFWLMDCQNVPDITRMAMELYKEAINVPFMAKFVIFAKHHAVEEGRLRMFCMTDDKVDKTLEKQEKFIEVARSKDVEVLDGRPQYIEMAGNLIPVTKSGDQLCMYFRAFRENRLPCTIRIRDLDQEASARVAFMKEPKVARGEMPQSPMCNLSITLPIVSKSDSMEIDSEAAIELNKRHSMLREHGIIIEDTVSRAQMKLTDVADTLQGDWVILAQQLGLSTAEINNIKNDYKTVNDQALAMLHLWVDKEKDQATGNALEAALIRINREDVVRKCMYNVENVDDAVEAAAAKVAMDQSGFDTFKEEIGATSRDSSMKRGVSLDVQFDEQDMVKESESAAEETSSESGSVVEKQAPTPVKEESRPDSLDDALFAILDDRRPAATTTVPDDKPKTPEEKREAYLDLINQMDAFADQDAKPIISERVESQQAAVAEAPITKRDRAEQEIFTSIMDAKQECVDVDRSRSSSESSFIDKGEDKGQVTPPPSPTEYSEEAIPQQAPPEELAAHLREETTQKVDSKPAAETAKTLSVPGNTMYEEVLEDGTVVKHFKMRDRPSKVNLIPEDAPLDVELLEEIGPEHPSVEDEEFEETLPTGTVHKTHIVTQQSVQEVRKTVKSEDYEKELYHGEIKREVAVDRTEVFEGVPERKVTFDDVFEETPEGSVHKKPIVISEMVQHVLTRHKSIEGDKVEEEEYEYDAIIPGTLTAFRTDVDTSTESSSAEVSETEDGGLETVPDPHASLIPPGQTEFMETLEDGTVVKRYRIRDRPSKQELIPLDAPEDIELVETEIPVKTDTIVEDKEEIMAGDIYHKTHVVRQESTKHVEKHIEDASKQYTAPIFEGDVKGPVSTDRVEVFVEKPEFKQELEEIEQIGMDGTVTKKQIVINRMVQHVTTKHETEDQAGEKTSEQEELDTVVAGTTTAFTLGSGSESEEEDLGDMLVKALQQKVEHSQQQQPKKPEPDVPQKIEESRHTPQDAKELPDSGLAKRSVRRVSFVPAVENIPSDPYPCEVEEEDELLGTPVITVTEDNSTPPDEDDFIKYYGIKTEEEKEAEKASEPQDQTDTSTEQSFVGGQDLGKGEQAEGGEAPDDEDSTKVMMKKQIHSKTYYADGEEKTYVHEETRVHQENEPPEELRDSMQQIIDQFMDTGAEVEKKKYLEDDV